MHPKKKKAWIFVSLDRQAFVVVTLTESFSSFHVPRPAFANGSAAVALVVQPVLGLLAGVDVGLLAGGLVVQTEAQVFFKARQAGTCKN